MAIALVTGTPGAGKTLYSLAVFLPAWLKPLVSESGSEIPRRLCAGNIRDLLLDHELIEVPRIRDWDAWFKDAEVSQWLKVERLPGSPPVPGAPHRADLWWLWCVPGDVICLDEAQHVFKPMAAGRAIPPHISNLEEHRHYGVDFLLITQHPNLLHANVRALCNPHLHVRRLFGRGAAMVYEFDRATNTGSLGQAISKKVWRYDKKAFSIYKSSELHTKQARGIPWQILLLVAALLALPLLVLNAAKRTDRMLGGESSSVPSAGAASAPGQAVPPGRARPVARPAFVGVVAELETWPDLIGGCWRDESACRCITQEPRPRVVSDRPALCAAVVDGLLSPPESHPPPRPLPAASAASGSASASGSSYAVASAS